MAVAAPQSMNVDENLNQITTVLEEVHIQQPNRCKRKEDAINKLFDSSKRKIDSLDSQRIMGIVEDTIRKTEVVTLLPFITENLERYSVMLGTDLCQSLEEYEKIQTSYSKACSNLRKTRQYSIRQGTISDHSEHRIDLLDDYQENVDFLAKELSNTIKTIMRKFKLNPSALQTIKGEYRERSSEANAMIDQLNQLQETIFTRLVTSPMEEIEKHKLTVQMMAREKKAQGLIKKLEVELKQEKKSKEKFVSKFVIGLYSQPFLNPLSAKISKSPK